MITLVRHTAVDVPAGTCYGRSDVPLRETFAAEAEVVRAGLTGRFGRVYTSPSSRCTRLTEHCGYAGAARDARLMELDFGAWEMRRWDDTDVATRWRDDWIDTPPPGGESLRQMYRRVSAFFDALPRGEDTLIFTHGGVIRCARAYFNGMPLEQAFETSIGYGEIVGFR
jgi:alpha-ribazole phosphatase